ncbi:MAG: tyrosine-type recombinase/integrase [SAR324 cluster bacterium]|nr:tyrosine-type recombinase/integrase [SAR324 cluster bacterium]
MNRLILQFTAHLHLKEYSQNSIQNHRLDLLKFKGWLEERDAAEPDQLGKISAAGIREYQGFMAETLKQRSINRHLSSLRLFFGFLEEAGLVSGNPLDGFVFQKPLPVLPNMLLPGEVSDLLDAPQESHYLGLRDRAMLELLYSSGLKLHELIGLNVGVLQLNLGFLKVSGKRERMVPITEYTAGLLKRYLEESRPGRILHPEEPCLFPGRNGTRITRVGVWKLIKKYARQAGIKKNFNPRALRHAFAMHLILRGMDLDGIKFLFGYKQLEATTLYAHVNTPDFREAYRAFHPSAAGE